MMLVMTFSKCLSRICYFATILIVFFNTDFSGANNLSRVCCIGCYCNVTENGECSLQYREKCRDGICNLFDFPWESSVIEVEISTECQQANTNSTESTLETTTKEQIKLDISEFDSETKDYVLLETRYLHIDESNTQHEYYLTRTSKALICVSLATDWSLCEVKFSVREWEYRRLKPEIKNPFSASGEILGEYVPNSVSLYQLPKDPTIKWKGIEVTIQNLEIDAENGEYLLIGAGSPDDYPPRFLSKITEYSLFYVANASAYIEFVSRSILKKADTFKILWNRIDAEKPDPIKPVDTLNAVLVCFYNYSEAKKEFEEKDREEVFATFREAFAASVRNNTEKDFYCSESSVKLIGTKTIENALSILIMLQCERKTFKYQELRKLMAIFESEDMNKALGYKVGLCPSMNNAYVPYNGLWNYLIYAVVSTLGLLIWAWKNNIFRQKCIPEKEKPTFGLETNLASVEQNTYETTIPKICLDDGYGRRHTLIPVSPQEEEDGEAEHETEVEMNAIPSTSQESDTLIRVLANRKNKRRPAIQSLISKKDENISTENFDVPKSEGDISEHLYDSVSSNQEIKETKM